MKVLKIHLIFLIVALLISFILIPLDQYFFDKSPTEEIKAYIENGITFKSLDAWKKVITWFIGLSCGRLMIKALMKAPIE